MCLIAFALGAHVDVPLLLAANRDEHFDRPTEPLHLWTLPDGTAVAAGRDRLAGGTWLGVSPSGRVAMLTNVREAQALSGPHSRGELVTAWLQSQSHWTEFVATWRPELYSGFNLVVGDVRGGDWAWITNRATDAATSDPAVQRPAPSLWARVLAGGVYGLSNAGLDTPWPKTVRLKHALQQVVDRLPSASHPTPANPLPADWRSALLAPLLDRQPAPWDTLPNTGAPKAWEHALSSPFVDYTERRYGTRSSLLMHATPEAITMEEWTHERPTTPPASAPSAASGTGTSPWPLSQSHYRRLCISM